MVRLVEVVLEPGKRTCPPLATPAGASRLRCATHPGVAGVGDAGGYHTTPRDAAQNHKNMRRTGIGKLGTISCC